VLDEIRPAIQMDGGDVELIDVDEEGVVTVELQGACVGCPMSRMTLQMGIARLLYENVPGITGVQQAGGGPVIVPTERE
jgi:Fe-S cluster biogenesis protein NfuA